MGADCTPHAAGTAGGVLPRRSVGAPGAALQQLGHQPGQFAVADTLRDAGFDLSDTPVFRHRKRPGLMAELLQGSARRAD